MELNISKQAVTINEMAYEGSLEQPVESDVLLPDYCPDIVKILRCFCTPKITGTQVLGDKLSVDLSCLLRVYYLGADKNIRCIEQKMPFTKTGDLKVQTPNPIVETSCKADYVNCRAVNQRRFEIRCAVTIDCRIFSRSSSEVVCGAEGCGIQLKSTPCQVTEICADISRQFSLHEDLQLSSQKPGVQSIIRQDCCCRISDYKVISGKVIVKGELLIHLLYQPETEDSSPEIMEYSLPVSQIVDVEGVDENSVCEVALCVVSGEFTPKVDLEGESRLLAMDCTLTARVRAHRRQDLQLITDCYSTEYECRIERSPMSCLDLIKVVDEKLLHKCSMNIPDGTDSVIDLCCLVTDTSSRTESGAVVAMMKLLLCLFGRDSEGDIFYYEQPEECELRIPIDTSGDAVLFYPTANVLSVSYSLSGTSSLECRIEIAVGGCVYSLMRPKVAVSISCDTAKAKERPGDASLIIYYATGGEDVWEIAKRYNTSLEAVMRENALDSTTLQDKRMLLIPIV